MARRIPPYASMRAFESAARLGSFRLASEEISISISAISHQIKSLEEFLGIPLFHRDKQRLGLTEPGKGYLLELTRALDLMAAATARVEKERQSSIVSINLYPSLASLWLLPRLGQFRRLEPNIDIRVITSSDPVDFRSGLLDMSVRYGETAPDAAKTYLLFKEEAFPVCSPRYFEELTKASSHLDLSNKTLIICQTEPAEWEVWFRDTGFAAKMPTHTIEFDSRALALEAAIDGLGIAMARTPYAHRALAAGRLVPLENHVLQTGKSYFLSLSENAARRKTARRFAEWLVNEARSN